jgi:hypothetical protein
MLAQARAGGEVENKGKTSANGMASVFLGVGVFAAGPPSFCSCGAGSREGGGVLSCGGGAGADPT